MKLRPATPDKTLYSAHPVFASAACYSWEDIEFCPARLGFCLHHPVRSSQQRLSELCVLSVWRNKGLYGDASVCCIWVLKTPCYTWTISWHVWTEIQQTSFRLLEHVWTLSSGQGLEGTDTSLHTPSIQDRWHITVQWDFAVACICSRVYQVQIWKSYVVLHNILISYFHVVKKWTLEVDLLFDCGGQPCLRLITDSFKNSCCISHIHLPWHFETWQWDLKRAVSNVSAPQKKKKRPSSGSNNC